MHRAPLDDGYREGQGRMYFLAQMDSEYEPSTSYSKNGGNVICSYESMAYTLNM